MTRQQQDPGGGTGPFGGLTQSIPEQQQAQSQTPGDENDISQRLLDPAVREEAAAILASQGLEPPSELAQLTQPTTPPTRDQGTGAQQNTQIAAQMLDQLGGTQQGTTQGQ